MAYTLKPKEVEALINLLDDIEPLERSNEEQSALTTLIEIRKAQKTVHTRNKQLGKDKETTNV